MPVLAAMCVLVTVSVHGQQRQPEEGTQVFPAGAELVVTDVVVRDKKGKTVRDLKPGEVEVYEDGVKQEVVSFTLRAAGEEETHSLDASVGKALDRAVAAVTGEAAPLRHINLVTLIFDQLGPDGRHIARQAGLALLDLTNRPDLFVSVFQVRESLRLVQQFTSERELLNTAIREATGDLNTQYTSATESLEEASRVAEEAQQRLESAAAVASAGQAGTLAQLGRDADINRMAVDALRLTQNLQREQQGNSSLYAILALAKQQQRLAGRKTILLFSEGLQVPPALEHVLRTAISEANRANVSVYAVDARGLVDARKLEATREALEQAALASQRQMMTRGAGPVTREQILATETAEAALRMDSQGALGDLAVGTGGLLIADSNDVRQGIQRAVGDLRGYYELVYEPKNQTYDGRFRKIEVKVRRAGLGVQARSGYFAIPSGEGVVTFPYEMDLLRALKAEPVPADFPFKVGLFRFGPEQSGVRYTAVLEIPLAEIAFEGDGRGDMERAHFALMAVLRDATGSVVEKFSEDSPVFVQRSRQAALKQGNAVFSRSFNLAPGRYTVEAAVVDQLGRHRSVQRSALNVRQPVTRVSVSDVAVVKRRELIPQGALRSEDPFRLGEERVVPFVTEARLSAGDTLSLFLVAYPKGASPRSDLLLELVRDGVLVAQSLVELPAPDERGRIPYIASIPAADLKPGRYEVRILFKQGGATAQESAFFTLDAGEPGPPPVAQTQLDGTRGGAREGQGQSPASAASSQP
jgi:VWFA-related protein